MRNEQRHRKAVDRLARRLRDLLGIIKRLDSTSCDFKSLTEPIDTSSPAGRLMLQILGAVAESERTLITKIRPFWPVGLPPKDLLQVENSCVDACVFSLSLGVCSGYICSMAEINDLGSVRARCPGCKGAFSTFEWRSASADFGVVPVKIEDRNWRDATLDFRLYRCAGCGRGGLGAVVHGGDGGRYPGAYRRLTSFYPEVRERLDLPKAVPAGIVREFREAEICLDASAFRAAAGMIRSVLDKTLRANGYKEKKGTNLEQQIDMAAGDGVITPARQRRAHDEIRVLGNDVLHDEWHEIPVEDVEAARHYVQRILEDFYDDRESVLKQLREAGRLGPDDKPIQIPPKGAGSDAAASGST